MLAMDGAIRVMGEAPFLRSARPGCPEWRADLLWRIRLLRNAEVDAGP